MAKAASKGIAAARGARLPYLPGLDGLRALAVVAVLLYHADLRWIPGGFLGVEVFFVISGYLITSLLLAEWRTQGGIDLRAFWLRRARRLLPALFVVIAAVLAFAVAFLPDEVAGLRNDAAAAIGYVTNWALIFSHKSYFETVGRPSLLRHLWSLAVEEQFYLAWPLLFAAGMRLFRRRNALMLPCVALGIAASTLLMAGLYQPDADPSRIYYGTDTRAAGLLTGAALALVWAPGAAAGGQGRRGENQAKARYWVLPRSPAPLLDLMGLAGLGVMIGAFLWLDEFQPFLYQGGFAVVALATVVVIAAVVHPQTRLSPALLGRRLLRWIGLRSYGIYLWHWPVFMVTRPQLDMALDGLPLLALRLGATLVLVELSYRTVEMPARNGALGRAWNAWQTTRGVPGWQLGIRWAGALGAVAAMSALGASVVGAQPPAPPSYLALEAVNTVDVSDAPARPAALALPLMLDAATQPTATPPAPTATNGMSAERWRALRERALAWATPEPTPLDLPPESARLPTPVAGPAAALRVMAIGDSVMISAVKELEEAIGDVEIDARIGRQVATAIRILQERREAGQLGDVVVIHVGNNGVFSAGQFDEMMAALAGVRRVVFVTVKVTHRWEEPNNSVLAEGVKRYPNAALVDWRAASADHPEYFWGDGIHLRPEGARVYAGLIAGAARAP